MMIKDLPTEEGQKFEPQLEYQQISASIRHLYGLRVAQLALFLLAMGGMLEILSGAPLERLEIHTANVFACFLTLMFWLLDERASRQYDYLLARAQSLERILHFNMFLNQPPFRFLRVRTTIRILYLGTLTW